MVEDGPISFRVACYSASGIAQYKDLFKTEDEAKSWAQEHLKGFDKIVVEKKDGGRDGWEPVATFTHR